MTVKARMLKLLEQHENELISGEAAAAELNCTRAAIWKAVKSLREEGYTIEAGLGENPLPLSQFDKIYKDNEGILLYGMSAQT